MKIFPTGELMPSRLKGLKRLGWWMTVIVIFVLLLLAPPAPAPANDFDSDGDGMADTWEDAHGLDPENGTDGGSDNDKDGLTNAQEYNNGTNSTDPNNPDTDGGGVYDGVEYYSGFNPNDPSDDQYVDSDGDGMPDLWESEHGLEPAKPADAGEDKDGDSYNNLEEYKRDSDPNDYWDPIRKETDDDGDADDMAMGVDNTMALCGLIFFVPVIVVLLVIILIYTKMRRDKLLEHDTRNKIYHYINRNPGAHYRAVMNDLGLHMGTLTHHLNMLEQQRYIKSYQDGMYRRFYPIDAKIDTGLILTDIQKNILHTIQDNPGLSQTGIAQKLGQTRKIVHYHIKLLADAGFVQVESAGRETNCYYLGGLDLDVSGTAKGLPFGRAG